MSAAFLELDRVRKSYDGRRDAVASVSLNIERGEFMTFLGPSGSGKTTTLMMIAGFETPNAGTIRLNGVDLAGTKPYHRNIGVVFQNYALFPHMTVAANVAFPLRMRGFARGDIAASVARLLGLVGLDEYRERYPRELSGGQQQRVALARGLVFEPDLLLLDEPLGALDKNLREQMQSEIKRIHRQLGTTMIYVTHDQSEAMTLSDRIAVFNAGRIEQAAPPLDVYNRPATRFVGEFIGDSNVFPVRVTDPEAGRVEAPGFGLLDCAPCDPGWRGAMSDALIRPEAVRPAVPSDRQSFEMLVTESVNHGDSVVLLGRIGTEPFRLRMLGNAIPEMSAGTRLRVAWPREAVWVVPPRMPE